MKTFFAIVLAACATPPPPAVVAVKPVAQPKDAASGCVDAAAERAQILHDVYHRYGKALALAQSGEDRDLKLAIEQLWKLGQDYPWFAPVQRGLGQANAARGNLIGAYVAYKRLLTYPSHPADRQRAATELRTLEDKQPALRAYAQGEELAKNGDWPKTVETMKNVVNQKPQFSLAHRMLGDALAATADKKGALAAYQTYLKLDPFSPDRTDVEARMKKLQ